MTLEDAIRHYEKLVYENNRLKQIKDVTLEECKRVNEWLQLAEWLKELKAVHDEIDDADDEDEIFIGYLRKKMRGE